MNLRNGSIAKPSSNPRNPRNEELFDGLVVFLEGIGGVDLTISDEMILSDVNYVAKRWGGFESDFVTLMPSAVQRAMLLKRAKREVLRRYLQEYVDEIDEHRRDIDEIEDDEDRDCEKRRLLENLANYLPQFPGRPAWPPEHAWLMLQTYFGKPLSPFDTRHWTKRLLAAAGLTDQPVVYFASFDDPAIVKIGWATNLKRRMRTFQTTTISAPTVHLAIPGDRNLEDEMHQRFGADRIRGELFRLSPDIIDFIAKQRKGA